MELPIFWLWESGTALLSRKLSRVRPHSGVRRVLAQKGAERPCKRQDEPCPFHFGTMHSSSVQKDRPSQSFTVHRMCVLSVGRTGRVVVYVLLHTQLR